VDHVLGQVREQVERLRELSPLWDMFKEGIDLKSVQWAAH
jgi:cysteine desulfurase